MSLYDTLGVDKDASPDAIKRAYRKRAMKHHPDRGGDAATFARLQEAHDVLMDPARRLQYDRSGDTRQHDTRQQMLAELAQMFLALVMQCPDLDRTNLVMHVRSHIEAAQLGIRQGIAQAQNEIRRMQRAAQRLKFSGDGENIIASMLQATIRDKEQLAANLETSLKRGDALKELLVDYAYETEPSMFSTTSGIPF
jgi:curved DNA-binding protein CbpA